MTAIVAAIGAHLRKPAPSRRVLNSSLAKNGMLMAIQEKSPTTFRQMQTRFMPMRAGLAAPIRLTMAVVSAIGAHLRMRAPSRRLLDSRLPANGMLIAAQEKSPRTFRALLGRFMPMRAGLATPIGLAMAVVS